MAVEDELYKYLSVYKTMPDWLKKVLTAPFAILPRHLLIGKMYPVFFEEARLMEFADRHRIEEYELLKLQGLIKHAFDTVPFYRKMWTEHGLNVSKVQSLEDFSNQVPIVTRDMVQANAEEFLSDVFSKNLRLKMNSSGSTGNPITIYYLKHYSRAAEWAHMHIQWMRVGYTRGRPMATLRGDYIGKNRIYSYDPWRKTLILNSFTLNRNNADDYVTLLREYKIEYINAYPSTLYNLIQLVNERDITVPSLKAILLGSENVFDWQVSKLKSAFNIDKIFRWYGHGEQCVLAGSCESSSDYHFLPTYGYFETAETIGNSNINGQVLAETSGPTEIIGTSFVNPLMPLIRYKTQDYGVTAGNSCECGRQFKRVLSLTGREQEIAVGANGEQITLTALICGRHAAYFDHIVKMQILNTSPGRLIVRIVPRKSFSADHAKVLLSSLSGSEGMPFEAKIEIVDTIPCTLHAKHRFLIREFALEQE
jgi:phenylacetate-CoA ligase